MITHNNNNNNNNQICKAPECQKTSVALIWTLIHWLQYAYSYNNYETIKHRQREQDELDTVDDIYIVQSKHSVMVKFSLAHPVICRIVVNCENLTRTDKITESSKVVTFWDTVWINSLCLLVSIFSGHFLHFTNNANYRVGQ